MTRFSLGRDPVSQARNRGYDDALAGKQKRPPEGTKERPAYLSAYRRGEERRVEIGR